METSDVRGKPIRKFGSGLLNRTAKLLDRAVFLCLLGVIVVTVIPNGAVDAWWEAVFECAVFAITAIWIFEVLLSGRWRVNRVFVILPLILITVYAFAQASQWPGWLASIDRYQTYLTARKILALTLFLGLLLIHTSSPRRLRWLVRVVIGLGLASALFGILRQSLQSPDATTGFVLPFLLPGMGYGQFVSPNVFAYQAEMTFGLLAGLILGGGIRRERAPFYLAIALFVWAALILCNSKAGIVGFACQSIFLLFTSLTWYSARRLSREDGARHNWLTFIQSSMLVRILGIVLIGGTLIMGVLWMGGQRLASKLDAQVSAQETIDGTTRKEIWRSSWRLIRAHPWTGVGFGAYFLAIPEYQISSGRLRLEQAHNDYLDLAANGGVVAVLLAGWFVAIIVLRARSSLRSRDSYRRAACLGAVAGVLSVGVHSLVDFGLQVTGIGVVCAALVVIAVANHSVESVTGNLRSEPLSHRRRRRVPPGTSIKEQRGGSRA